MINHSVNRLLICNWKGYRFILFFHSCPDNWTMLYAFYTNMYVICFCFAVGLLATWTWFEQREFSVVNKLSELRYHSIIQRQSVQKIMKINRRRSENKNCAKIVIQIQMEMQFTKEIQPHPINIFPIDSMCVAMYTARSNVYCGIQFVHNSKHFNWFVWNDNMAYDFSMR